MAENLPPVHAQVADGLGRRRAAVDVEEILKATIGTQARRDDAAVVAVAVLRLGFEYDRSRAVSKQDARAAVLPVENS